MLPSYRYQVSRSARCSKFTADCRWAWASLSPSPLPLNALSSQVKPQRFAGCSSTLFSRGKSLVYFNLGFNEFPNAYSSVKTKGVSHPWPRLRPSHVPPPPLPPASAARRYRVIPSSPLCAPFFSIARNEGGGETHPNPTVLQSFHTTCHNREIFRKALCEKFSQ